MRHDGPLRVAHRGGAGQWPENTMFAFRHAVDMGVDALELDIHATRDGELVALHDDTVDRTTNGSGAVRDMTLAELRELDAGFHWTGDDGRSHPFRGKGIVIPTLAEVLDAFDNVRLAIEIKPDEPALAGPVGDTIREHGTADRVLVGSFHTKVMRAFRRLFPEVPTAAGESEVRLFYCLTRLHLAAFHAPNAAALVVPEWDGRIHVVTPQSITAAHGHGMRVYVWTVNDRGDMARLLDWGVDGLISDYPDRLLPS